MLPESAWATWLDVENHDTATLHELLVPSPADELEKWPVSTLVNKADNNGPELVRPVEGSVGADGVRATLRSVATRGSRARCRRARRGCRRAGSVVSGVADRGSARSRRPAASLGRGDRGVAGRRSARSLVGRRAAAARRAARLVRRRGRSRCRRAARASIRQPRRGRGRPTQPPDSGPGARRTRPRCTGGTRRPRPARTEPIDHALAVDGIDEFFGLIPFWRRESTLHGAGESIHLHCTDGDGEWFVRLAADGVIVTREHAKGDVALRAPASDLLLFLYGRVGPDRR